MGSAITRALVNVLSSGVIPTVNDIRNPIRENDNPDSGLGVTALIEKYQYPHEIHTVQTDDGYLLDIHRIPYGIREETVRQNGNGLSRPVAFLMAGLLCSSADWICMGPDKGLGYLLADKGYDVWMGNARGTTHSRKHISLDPDKDAEFWRFSYHEIALHDMPAMLDYTLNVTGQEDLYYVGHSQGTTSIFVLTSYRPEYNDKIRVMLALAPVAYMNHVKNPFLRFVSRCNKKIEFLANMLGMNEFAPDKRMVTFFGNTMCHDHAMTKEICHNVIFLIAGFDSNQLNETAVPVIMTNTPAGCSTRQILHFSQGIISGKFRPFDDGPVKNVKQYNQLLPPDYNLENIKLPIVLVYSDNDWLTSPTDIKRLRRKLPNVVGFHRVNNARFNHLDFLWAIDVVDLVYNIVFETFSQY